VVVDHDERVESGLDLWCDGTMGIHRTDGRTLVVSPNGGRLAHHDLSGGDFAHALLCSESSIRGHRGPWDHASGGPLLASPDGADLLLVYHGETFTDGEAHDYYSFLGMARSVDGGRRFDDLGPVVRLHHRVDDPQRPRPVEIGSGSPVVHDGWLHLYFQDRTVHEVSSSLSVARARLDDVWDAVRADRAPSFTKYHGGRWSSPGLDGPADDLLSGCFPPALWSDTAWVDVLDCFLVLYSTVTSVVGGLAEWMHFAALSRDGVTWGQPRPLYSRPVIGEILYLSIDSTGQDQRRIEGTGFDLYRIWSDRRWRWHNARLERVRVEFDKA
jgi:hypothetical protein